MPDHVSFPDAIAAVGTGRTALGVLELEPPAKEDVVLVPSAAGGLGWLLAQAASAVGATVVAAAGSAERVAALAPLGADLVVDYSEPGWADQVRERTDGVTLVYDGVGGDVGRAALELLRPGGRLVMFGYSAGAPTEFDVRRTSWNAGSPAGWSLGPRMMALPGGIPGLAARALERVAAGDWRPLVTTYPLADAARAHADLEQRRALGKVVLDRAAMNSIAHCRSTPIRLIRGDDDDRAADGDQDRRARRRVGKLPRALTPFRTPPTAGSPSRWSLTTFAGGVWVVGAGLGGHPDRRRPRPAVRGLDRRRDRRAAARPCSAAWSPTGCRRS